MDLGFRRLLYLRYADDFVILLTAPHIDAVDIRTRLSSFLLANCGLELNTDKTIISHVRQGFKFLGAFCRGLNRDAYLVKSTRRYRDGSVRKVTGRVTPHLFVTAPIRDIIMRMATNGFVKRNAYGVFIPTALRRLIHLDMYDILSFYNSKVRGLLSFYGLAGNFSSLAKVVWLFRQSCALTLALKFKLKTARKTYKKFGPSLTDPTTKHSFQAPSSYKVKHDYPSSTPLDFNSLLDIDWSGRLTNSNAFQSCALCGSSSDIEMHHVRSVKDVRARFRSRQLSYAQWVGGMARKQVPLCQYHHNLLHQGQLNHADLMHLAKYRGK